LGPHPCPISDPPPPPMLEPVSEVFFCSFSTFPVFPRCPCPEMEAIPGGFVGTPRLGRDPIRYHTLPPPVILSLFFRLWRLPKRDDSWGRQEFSSRKDKRGSWSLPHFRTCASPFSRSNPVLPTQGLRGPFPLSPFFALPPKTAKVRPGITVFYEVPSISPPSLPVKFFCFFPVFPLVPFLAAPCVFCPF